MKPEEIRKLLGGYATGTLTDAERSLLFTAALEDQALFDALADEESLRALLSDPAARGELLAVIDENGTLQREAPDREEWREAQPTAMRQPSPMPASATQPSPPDANSSRAETWNGPWVSPWPKGIALVGALAVVIVIIAVLGIQRNRPTAPVEVAKNEQPLPVPPRQLAPATQALQTPAAQPAIEAQNAPSIAAIEKRSIQSAPPAGRRDAPNPTAPSGQIPAGGSATQAPTVQAAPPPAPANPNPSAAESNANVKDASKESERKVEEKDQQLASAAEARPAQPARVEPAPSAPPAAARKTEQSDNASRAKAAPLQSFAVGALTKSRFAEPRLAAAISDINGSIISINAGTNAGWKNADTLEIVRDGAVLGTVRLTDTRATFALGSLTRSPRADPPRAGDSVRLQAPPAR